MKKLLSSCLLLFTVSLAVSQTTLEEYNYLTKGYKLKITGKVKLLNNSIGEGDLGSKKMQIIPYYIEILEKQELTARK